ncbi:unnamed protein product [Microthlaspi erraticum]|uniref:Uncharacterized protein n=1 Tax=Microthlaspi erraticum TaxID=1685480 RepID=A0A6D2JKF3_9BRAS|nr:unnamed protein product [Microthlaspi erraticum]
MVNKVIKLLIEVYPASVSLDPVSCHDARVWRKQMIDAMPSMCLYHKSGLLYFTVDTTVEETFMDHDMEHWMHFTEFASVRDGTCGTKHPVASDEYKIRDAGGMSSFELDPKDMFGYMEGEEVDMDDAELSDEDEEDCSDSSYVEELICLSP